MASTVNIGGKCPSGGSWYACATGTYFVGCCARNPCSVMCSAGDIYSAAFNAAAHGQFPDASCGTGSQFWTCAEGNTFLGCCKSNPCSQGAVCPKSDLEPALLSRDDLRIAYGAVSAVSSSAASSTRASSIESSTASRSSSIISPTSTNTSPAAMTTSSAQNDGPPVAAIAGGAAGGAFVLAMIIGLVIFCVCRKRRSRRGPEKERQSDQPEMATVMHTQKDTFDPADAPPGYASPKPHQYYDLRSGQHVSYQHNQTYIPEPQELPSEPRSPTNFSRKPVSHQRNFSELSGDTAIRSELESPHTTPKLGHSSGTPIVSPLSQETDYLMSAQDSPAMSSWSPQQNWHSSPRSEYLPTSTQGLGLEGTGLNNRFQRTDIVPQVRK